jgi:nitrite reductase (NADH) small subunit
MSGADESAADVPEPAASNAPTLQRVGSLAKLRSSGNFAANVAGRRLAVFSVQGDVVVTPARCPHAKGPIQDGIVEADILTCPWHGYTFNLRTGACDDDPDLVLQRFDVHIVGDDILVNI